MAFLVSLLRVVLLLFVVRLVLRAAAAFVRGVQTGLRGAPEPPRGAPAVGHELVRDRVCNTFLPRERALRALVGGHEEHFCSAACRDKALRAVAQAS